jgi:hypothetical protein
MSSTANPDPQITKLSTLTNLFFNNIGEPLIAVQEKKCERHLIAERNNHTTEYDKINNLRQKATNDLSQVNNNYMFDSQNQREPKKIVDNVAVSSTKRLPRKPDDLPLDINPSKLKKRKFYLGEKVYGIKYSQL